MLISNSLLCSRQVRLSSERKRRRMARRRKVLAGLELPVDINVCITV